MLEIIQGCSYVLSFMFFWTGATYFDMQNRKLKAEMETAKKLEEIMKNKEFIREYLKIKESVKEESSNDKFPN